MILADFHLHTKFCDGVNTPREMVEEAIKKGLNEIGFSVHSYTFFDNSFCIEQHRIEEYKAEINSLKKEFADRIKIYVGVEMDYYSDMYLDEFDYSIGSVHYVKKGQEYLCLDESEQSFINIVENYYGGDYYALCEEYFSIVADVVERVNPKIIGHFDIITKFNEGGKLFDEQNPRYVESYKKAIDKLVIMEIPFEVNLGAIIRKLKSQPYPSLDILRYIKEKGGKVILSSDSHCKENICFEFDRWSNVLEEIGLEQTKINL